ncbi:MAG: ATP-dependent 6-phosphofructokinase, partial [Candidatus Omnitrophica bacterium]|nr:ATP-dependent 6-phosphofructokinase [Candidatus Omnitrophota bacterium]
MQNIIVTNLGEACRTSPLHLHNGHADGGPHFIPDQARVLNSVEINSDSPDLEAAFEKAGPREKIFFDPGVTRAAIVTCGGLCPGLNNVIRSLVLELYHNYGVRDIRGIRYGYDGMGRRPFDTVVALDPNIVDAIDRQGGSMLGCSRGNPPLEEMAGFLLENRIDMLFAIGGDGTQRGAWEISKELQRRGAPVAVVGIP